VSIPWILFAALIALLVAMVASGFLLLAMGRLHLDLGWGRSLHELGPISVRIEAPRELVFGILGAPYLGRASGGSEIELIARDGSLAVAAHYTRVHFYTARTVEVIELDVPGRIGFRHLTGPVPHAVEWFELTRANGATELHYGGELGIDFSWLGRIAGRRWVRPQWESTVRAHMEDVRHRAEQRAERQRSRQAADGPGQSPEAH
jgi:hypothetical protein